MVVKGTRYYNGLRFTRYPMKPTSKSRAKVVACELRDKYNSLARIVKIKGGYIIYVSA